MQVNALHPVLGAEIIGLDLSGPLPDEVFAAVRATFNRYSVVVFRGQQALTPAQHVAFSRRFGALEYHVMRQFLHPEFPEILLVSNEKRDGRNIGLADAGRYWHSDLSYKAEPSLGSLLHAKVLPAEGGDTLFASMVAAYANLPAPLRARLDGLQAEHDYAARVVRQRDTMGVRPDLSAAQRAEVPPVVHPVVRVHPETGKRALFVSEGFTTRILGIPEDESRAILDQLFAASIAPDIIYRHRWQDGDMVMWDNRAVIHLAAGCPPDMARTMYRTTVKGDRPSGVAA
ncbi:TauD/TfdA dioxygenase family protein [Limobrevibacterium gyesilva]|uniref:TauD/TfdA family dioxygenase n=1 Tax=Limobrevibacterium gyesilva TaxID=2991712 RepID=A0AA41YKY5_9PROT|nr:TauD/TfdA family dioxygenase [Limobrevibacterium gyesilva]MCW3474296.1 TauD/TfdA family dioxygenase [Limobrevibacterium gyesilva]